MIRRRTKNKGLPWRVYAKFGARVWRSWYQPAGAPRETLVACFPGDMSRAEFNRRTRAVYAARNGGQPEAEQMTFAALCTAYMEHQRSMSPEDEDRKAESTLDENEAEIAMLCKVFGRMAPDAITQHDWYGYQDACRKAGRGAKSNKEIALASAIFRFGIQRGVCTINSAKGVTRVKTKPAQRTVELAEIDAVLAVARTIGPAATLQALAARTAWLCVRRPPEILSMTPAQDTPEGLRFQAVKRKAGEAERTALIAWSPELRATIDEAKAIKRRVDISPLIFGNMEGKRYTRSGWGANWRRLMDTCAKRIDGFERFTLQDCRPGGVTAKEERGDADTQNATLHKDGRMIQSIYDRRRVRRAKPAS